MIKPRRMMDCMQAPVLKDRRFLFLGCNKLYLLLQVIDQIGRTGAQHDNDQCEATYKFGAERM